MPFTPSKTESVDTKINDGFNTFNDNDKTGNKFLIIAAVIIFFIIFGVLSWIFNVLSLKDRACENLDKIYTANNKYATTFFSHANGIIKSNGKKNSTEQLNYFDDELACLVKNYYVKTAYNCCCGDGYKNNFVNMFVKNKFKAKILGYLSTGLWVIFYIQNVSKREGG